MASSWPPPYGFERRCVTVAMLWRKATQSALGNSADVAALCFPSPTNSEGLMMNDRKSYGRNHMHRLKAITAASAVSILAAASLPSANAADQTVPGAGNSAAAALASSSPLVQSARRFIGRRITSIGDHTLAQNVHDLVEERMACVHHRAHESDVSKQAVLDKLAAAGLYSAADAAAFPGGAMAGIFPPVVEAGTACPHLPQPFFSAPGSVFGGHHSYPGGLPIHESFNDLSDTSFAANYRRVYGHTGPSGLPVIAAADSDRDSDDSVDVDIDEDVILAAPLLHDWAKPLVFQWNADGSEFAEFNFGGNGTTDNYGSAGDSRTGAHHIIGIVESMARGLSPRFVITQASAHSNPTSGNEYKVVNWLRAAAIMARIDPVAKGYLMIDGNGNYRLPALRKLGSINLGEVNALAEYELHNLSDADFTFSGPAITGVEAVLQSLASEFGYDPSDASRYNNKYRNPVFSFMTAERLYIVYSQKGSKGVEVELRRLRNLGVI